MFDVVVLTLLALVILTLVALLARNNRVLRWRLELLDRIHIACHLDHVRGREWAWRYEEFDAVPYGSQVLRVWKPLGRFYPRDPARSER